MLYCTYCDWPGPAEFFVWDHAIPLSRGGVDAPYNRVVACMWCNAQKGMKTELQYRAWRLVNPQQANFGPH